MNSIRIKLKSGKNQNCILNIFSFTRNATVFPCVFSYKSLPTMTDQMMPTRPIREDFNEFFLTSYFQ